MRYGILRKIFRRERPHLLLAARGTLAALLALATAVALELESPYWAAMTALIVIQPTRGLLLEKSFYRLVGTAFGAGAGLLILLVTRSPLMISLLLACWLAGCVGIGNLLYGLRSYGAMIAGCTCAVVAMAGYSNPPHLHAVVFGRIADIVVGIVVATTVTLYFTQRRSKREVLARLAETVITSLEWTAQLIRGDDRTELNVIRDTILTELAEIENSLDACWAGSLDLKKRKQLVNNLIVNLLSHLEAGTVAEKQLQLHGHGSASWREALAEKLEWTIDTLREPGLSNDVPAGLPGVMAELSARLPRLARSLDDILTSLHAAVGHWDATMPTTERPAVAPHIRHRDWQEAGRAGLRAASAMVGVGLVWSLTGWQESPLMVMAAAIMVSIFSTHDRPTVMLGHIFRGAALGVIAAFIVRLLVLPGTSSSLMQTLLCIPFLLAGSMALHHRSTARAAMDAMLFFLFVMQPGLPAVPPPATYVLGGLASLGGIGVAILSFRFLLPIDPERRLNSLLSAIVRDLLAMAGSDSAHNLERSRYRLQHRVLRLFTNARKIDADISAVVEGGLAALIIGSCLLRHRNDESHGDTVPRGADPVLETTRQLSAAVQRPGTILPLLESLVSSLWRTTEALGEANAIPCSSSSFR